MKPRSHRYDHAADGPRSASGDSDDSRPVPCGNACAEEDDDMPSRPKAFVTGASRGIGAEIAEALARAGWDVALGYRARARRAGFVAERLRAMGADTVRVAGDIADAGERSRLLTEVRAWAGGHLDALVLNAAGSAGGADAAVTAAGRMSDAQVRVVRALVRELSPGGRVVYVTSHWAHLYGNASWFPPWYASLAASKHDSERALRALQPTLAASRRDIRLLVVSAGIASGTVVGDGALERYPEFAAEQRAIGNIVTAEEIGRRVAQVIADVALPNGHVEVVGAPLEAVVRRRALG